MARKPVEREARPDELTKERAEEIGKCLADYTYFISKYCYIYDSVSSDWIKFKLWPAQVEVLKAIDSNQLTVILKARQLGITWLALSYALWSIIFRPIASVSIFSRREPEAIYMLGSERLRGMYDMLPAWMRSGHKSTIDAGREWILANRSAVRAFPTSAGDGYVSTLAIVDEADLAPDLNKLLRSVKPTIDNGGKLILLSRVNKSEPESEFKAIYRNAKTGKTPWHPVFLPWSAHPGRNSAWYNDQKQDILSRTGALDDLYEQYPATDTEALAEKTLDKRIPPMWIELCYSEGKPIWVKNGASLPNFDVYVAPEPGKHYVLGADPAEGNPNSDDSAITVLDVQTGEEVAHMAGKYEPSIFAHYISQVSAFYNYAPAMVERNNHGHSVIQWLEEHARRVRLLLGHDAEMYKMDKKTKGKRKRLKAGWLSSTLGKTMLYTGCTEFFRVNSGMDGEEAKKVLHTFSTYVQLCSIEAATLKAPEGRHDDKAVSFALAVVGREQLFGRGNTASLVMATAKGW